MSTCVVLAHLPGTDCLAATDDQGRVGLLSPGAGFEPLWDWWVDAAVIRYGYERIAPRPVRAGDLWFLTQALNHQHRAPVVRRC